MWERLPSQTVLTVFCCINVHSICRISKTAIDTGIYYKDFDYFAELVLEVRKKIAQKRAPYTCATEASESNSNNK